MLETFRGAGFAVAAEAFADRRYEPDGSLRSRKFTDALILDPAEAAAQALRICRMRQGYRRRWNGNSRRCADDMHSRRYTRSHEYRCRGLAAP